MCEQFAGFDVVSFTESQWPEGAFAAQQVQAASYLDMGYVKADAIDDDGRLHQELDHSRDGSGTYFAALDAAGTIQASIRLTELQPGEDLVELPSYRHAQTAISDEAGEEIARLRRIGARLVDGSALCKLPTASPLASYAVIREAIRHGIRADSEVVWLMTVTTAAWQTLKSAFGSAMWQIGGDVPTEHGDDRVVPTKLIPAMAAMKAVPARLVEDIEATEDPATRSRLIRTLALIVDGLEDHHLGADPFVGQRVRSHLELERAESLT